MQIRKNRSTILLLVYILFVIYCFVFGDNGILKRRQLIRHKKEINDSIARLIQENNNLQKEYSIISNNQTNSNFYKEEASKSAFIASGEKYIFFKSRENKDIIKTEAIAKEDKYPVEISHLRILWIVISIIVIFFYFLNRNKEKKNMEEIL